jgi:AbrB family looped-hinge helix DNA binding protein
MKNMISSNLRALRSSHKFTLEEVAEKIGVTRQSVAKWESGETLPDILKCQELAFLYDTTLEMLVFGQVGDDGASEWSDDGKYVFGIVTVGERGQIVIPKRAREVFRIERGDRLIIVGDEKRGMGIAKVNGMASPDNFIKKN